MIRLLCFTMFFSCGMTALGLWLGKIEHTLQWEIAAWAMLAGFGLLEALIYER